MCAEICGLARGGTFVHLKMMILLKKNLISIVTIFHDVLLQVTSICFQLAFNFGSKGFQGWTTLPLGAVRAITARRLK